MIKPTKSVLIDLLRRNLAIVDIAAIYSCDRNTISRLMKKYGITKQQFAVQHDYFNKIDHQNKAYWLGLLFADGTIKKNSTGKYMVCLGMKDTQHVERYANIYLDRKKEKFQKWL